MNQTDFFLWHVVFLVALTYELNFTQATLLMGKALSETESKTGFQDAITPPWQTNVAMFVYAVVFGMVVAAFYMYGIWSGLGAIALVLVMPPIFRRVLLPKPNSLHFHTLIVRSMMSRYARYRKNNDFMRAEAMGSLLIKAGYPVPDKF